MIYDNMICNNDMMFDIGIYDNDIWWYMIYDDDVIYDILCDNDIW